MKHGEQVSAFESAFADYVQARHAIAMPNGTVTIQVALMALGVKSGYRVSTTALTMSATTIAILNAGGVPVYNDVNPTTWLMEPSPTLACFCSVPVSLYGLHQPFASPHAVDDAAQTLRPHGGSAFTSYSLQRSKILQTGEGGVLVTNDEGLAAAAREIASLGYKLGASQSRIDSSAIKSPTFDRHHRAASLNARMNDITAAEGLKRLGAAGQPANELLQYRSIAAASYRNAIAACGWLTPQHVPDGFTHDYWCWAVACDSPDRALRLADAVVKHGGERPYPAWKLTYQESAFRHLAINLCADCYEKVRDRGQAALCRRCGSTERHRTYCPIAESLQPRLLQFQTNDLASAERNAGALRKAIEEMS